MKDGWDYEEYIDFLNHLFLQELCDMEYLSFTLNANLGEL